MLFSIPILPLGKVRILDECPTCGHRGQVKARQFQKERKKNLALMMEGFTHSADDPDNCCFALHTLTTYGEETWFRDLQKTYGLRFESNQEVQLLIARGFCRFGDYDLAIEYCQKAIALGAGKNAQELLELCLTALVATKHSLEPEPWTVREEPMYTAYIPIATVAAALAVYLLYVGFSSLHNYKAWIVNGSLRPYSFFLDDKRYTLNPGECRQTTLRLGEHELKQESTPATRFTYAIPLIKQLLDKHLLVINPDEMAFFAISEPDEDTASFSHGEQIRIFSGLRQPLRGIRKRTESTGTNELIRFYRPDTHMAMVQQMRRVGQNQTAVHYARQALTMEPDSSETPQLLEVALQQAGDEEVRAFLRQGLNHSPILLPWHLKYQNYMMEHHSEYNLEREYTLWCKDRSDEPAAYYLLARVVDDRAAAYRFFEHSEKQSGMGGMGYYAIARDLFIRGAFRQALPYADRAVACNNTNAQFIALNRQLLFALRDYDTLVGQGRPNPSATTDEQAAKRFILYLTCAGFHKEAEANAVKFSDDNVASLPALNAVRFYAVGNLGDYLECLAEAGDPHVELERMLHQNRIVEADHLISQQENHPYWEHLLLYCAAMSQHLPEVAETNRRKAITEIDEQTMAAKTLEELLSGPVTPSIETIRKIDLDAVEKAILCVTLGYRFPEQQAAFSALAAEYNFNRSYPQLLLKKWIRNATGKSAEE